MGGQFRTPLVSLLTQRVQMVLLTDGTLQKVVRDKIRHYRQNYLNQPDPIVFIPVVVDTPGRIYDDFNRLLLLNAQF